MSANKTWYTPDQSANEPLGPLSSDQIEQMFARGELTGDSYIWGQHLGHSRWCRMSTVEEFQHILKPYPPCAPPRKLSSGKSEQEVPLRAAEQYEPGHENIYRRYPRVPLDAPIIVHDNETLCTGRVVDISEKGASFVLVGATLKQGQEIAITFRGLSSEIGTFSSSAVVVRIDSEGRETRYGIFFLRLNPRHRRQLAIYVINSIKQEDMTKSAA